MMRPTLQELERRRKISEKQKASWTPERRKKQGGSRPLKVCREISRGQKARWKKLTPEQKQEIALAVKSGFTNEVRAQMSAISKAIQADPVRKRNAAERTRAQWQIKAVRQRML